MAVWIALLRGINVGGATLKMKDLAATLEDLRLEDVKTYIQSGNVVFKSGRKNAARLAGDIRKAIAKAHKVDPHVIVLSQKTLERAAAANPFPEAEDNPKSVHLYFLDSAPKKPDTDKLAATAGKNERFALKGAVFYLHTPEGFGVSKLAERAEKALGVPATARNWRTVGKLIEMAKEI